MKKSPHPQHTSSPKRICVIKQKWGPGKWQVKVSALMNLFHLGLRSWLLILCSKGVSNKLFRIKRPSLPERAARWSRPRVIIIHSPAARESMSNWCLDQVWGRVCLNVINICRVGQACTTRQDIDFHLQVSTELIIHPRSTHMGGRNKPWESLGTVTSLSTTPCDSSSAHTPEGRLEEETGPPGREFPGARQMSPINQIQRGRSPWAVRSKQKNPCCFFPKVSVPEGFYALCLSKAFSDSGNLIQDYSEVVEAVGHLCHQPRT
jgi:hypothetical protein